MRGFTKRFGSLILGMLLACTLTVTAAAAAEDCPGECTHQAAVGSVHYDTLEAAIAAAGNGDTVTLLADGTLTAPLTPDKSITLDLGGKTLTGTLHLTAGGTLCNGTVVAAEGPALLVSDCAVTIEKDAVLKGCGTSPTLSVTAAKAKTAQVKVSGKLSGKGPAPVIDVSSSEGSCELYILKKAKLTAQDNAAIAFDCAGKLDIAGGTVQTKKDILSVAIEAQRDTELSITGGKLLSEEGEAVVIDLGKKAEPPKDFVTGGTYKKVPTAYVPDYCKIRDNQDGTYTVISSYTLSFQANGGSGTMESVAVRCGSAVKLPKCSFKAAKGMDFAGWEIGGKTYAPGDKFTPEEDVTVTALWKTHTHTGGSATCLKKAKCETCGKSYGKLGSHKLSAAGGYGATCTDVGMNAHSRCSNCGGCFVNGVEVSEDSLYTPALGHSWQTVDGKPATCTEDGIKTYDECLTCGSLHIDGAPVAEEELPIPATGHTLESVAATQATCTQAGLKAHEHCSVCDEQFVAGQIVDEAQLTTATATHVLSDWINDELYHWKTCVDCNETFRQGTHADTDLDGACNDCGYTMPVTEEEAPGDESGFSWLFLIPVIAAVAIAVPLVLKKRK